MDTELGCDWTSQSIISLNKVEVFNLSLSIKSLELCSTGLVQQLCSITSLGPRSLAPAYHPNDIPRV